MARYEFETREESLPVAEGPGDVLDLFGRVLDVIARIVGLIVLGIGFWLALSVIAEGWDLYRRPDNGRIEQVARAINRGSNLDEVLAPRPAAKRKASVPAPAPATGVSDDPVAAQLEPAMDVTPEPDTPAAPPIRLSYFCAWFVVLALLAILGHLAMLAVRTGGALVARERRPRRL
jgi:hypothetical protein